MVEPMDVDGDSEHFNDMSEDQPSRSIFRLRSSARSPSVSSDWDAERHLQLVAVISGYAILFLLHVLHRLYHKRRKCPSLLI
jgi:hypothetical protein